MRGRDAVRLPKRSTPRSFTRAQLPSGRYVQLLALRGERAEVLLPNGARLMVPRGDLSSVESFTTFGSGA